MAGSGLLISIGQGLMCLSHYEVEADLELLILLLPPPENWDCRRAQVMWC